MALTTEQEMEYERDLRRLKRWNAAYRKDGESPVSDAVYDGLYIQTKATYQELLKTVPSAFEPFFERIVEGNLEYEQYPHKTPMLSLHTEVDTTVQPIIDWINRMEKKLGEKILQFSIEGKYDGVSLEIVYENCQAIRCLSRGDGMYGEDLSRHFLQGNSIPNAGIYGSYPSFNNEGLVDFDVRGEVVLLQEDFDTINAERKEVILPAYKNKRNAVAGILRRKATDKDHKRLVFIPYQLIPTKGDGENFKSQTSAMISLCPKSDTPQSRGIVRGISFLGDATTEAKAAALYKTYTEVLEKRPRLPYDIDGVVYKVDSATIQDNLGFTEKEPNWALAHKFSSQKEETVIKDIILQVGKTGVLTPVAILEPVVLGGTVVSRSTLVNKQRMLDLNVGYFDTVLVERGGDTIPGIVKVAAKHDPGSDESWMEALFEECPSCNSLTEQIGPQVFCTNTSGCPAQKQALMERAVSRDLFDIKGVGEKTVEQLIAMGVLNHPFDLFSLTEEHLVKAGIAQSQVGEVMDRIEKARSKPLNIALAALGIERIGRRASSVILKAVGSLDALYFVKGKDLANLKRFGIAQIAATSEYFNNPLHVEKVKSVKQTWTMPEEASVGSVSLSGSFDVKRSEIEDELWLVGVKLENTPKAGQLCFVQGERPSPGKVAKAKELGLKIVTALDELYKEIQ